MKSMENVGLLINQFGWAGVIMLALASYIVKRDSNADLLRKEQEARLDKIYGELFTIQKETVQVLAEVKAELSRAKGDTP